MGFRSTNTGTVPSILNAWLHLERINEEAPVQGIRTSSRFSSFAKSMSRLMGQPAAFAVACAIIILWAAAGPIFNFSDTWQLIINTGTTIVTFLMVFLIQNTQNRDSEAMHIKLDELIRAIDEAQNALLNLEELEEEDLDRIRADYLELAKQSRSQLRAPDLSGAGAHGGNGSSIAAES